MKILVAGGAGYIGSHMVYDLLMHGHQVVVVDNFSNSTDLNLHTVERLTGTLVPVYKQDIRQGVDVLPETGFDAVMHFAAYKSVPDSVSDPLKYYENNIGGVINLLKWARDQQVPGFVFSSTAAVYGRVAVLPVNEQTPAHPESPYGYSKLFAERVIADASRAYGINSMCLRYFNVAGNVDSGEMGDEDMSPSALIPAMICSHLGLRRQQFQVFGDDYDTRDGSPVRDFVHVLDLVEAHRLALDYLQAHSGNFTFNLGSQQGITVKEMIAAFESASGERLQYTVAPRREGDIPVSIADSSLARSALQWHPAKTVADMVSSAYKWYKSRASVKIPA